MTLSDFLLARIAEDEAAARAVIAANHEERDYYAKKGMPDYPADAVADFELSGPVDGPSGWAAVYIGPARVLAECEAKRRIVEHHAPLPDEFALCAICTEVGPEAQQWPCFTLKALALPYADHPDYDESWKP